MPGSHDVRGDAGIGLFDVIILALKEANTLKIATVIIFFNELVGGHQVLEGILGDGNPGEGEVNIG